MRLIGTATAMALSFGLTACVGQPLASPSALSTVSPAPTASPTATLAFASPKTSVSAPTGFDCTQYGPTDRLPQPGLDPALEGMFPAAIKNHTLSSVLTYRFMAFLCASPSDPNAASDFVARLPAGWDAGAITYASAAYDFASHPSLDAIRMPGRSGTDLLAVLAAGAQQQIDGKTVTVQPSEDPPGASYFYSSGDVVFHLFEMVATDAADILAALP